MKSRFFCFAFVTSCLVGSPQLPAQTPAALPDSFDVQAIDTFLAQTLQQNGQPGFSIAIVKNGELVLAKGYGKRALEDGRPVETDTLFAIGSVSKQFTCAAILLLAEDGKLSVHDKVAKYYPDLTRANDITLLDLMNHVSGYPDYYPLDFVDRRMRQPIAPDELLRQYAGAKLDFEPGSKYSYSNTGYILLGRVVEKVSGKPFGEFLTERLFQPLGMHRTVHEPELSDPRLARGYTTFALSAPEHTQPEANGWIGAAGGMYSTPSDLAKWNLALISGRVLKPESYALMTAPRKLSDGKISEYGCGLGVRMQNNRQVLTHGGAVSGFVTFNGTVPSTRSSLTLMCNQDAGLGPVAGQIFSLLMKEPSNVPTIRGPATVDAVKRAFAGFQKGRINREEFSEEFNYYLTDAKLAGASKWLKGYGAPQKVEVLSTNERGGMEVTTSRLTFKKGNLRALMYRMPDGVIEQFFVYLE